MAEFYTNQSSEDKISLKEFILKIKEWISYLWIKKLTIIIIGLIGGVLGLIYSSVKKPLYIATTTFVLEEGENSNGLGQYMGIASMMGIDLSNNGGGIFKGDNIIQLYKSRKMIKEALLTIDTFEGKKVLLIDRFIEFNKIRENWKDKPDLLKLQFKKDYKVNNRLEDSVISKIVEVINGGILEVSKPDKKTSIIQVDVKTEDELFSKSFAENIVATVNKFYVETKTKKSVENIRILQFQADSVRKSLDANIGRAAAVLDANPNINLSMQRLKVGSEKKQVDIQVNSSIYQEIVKNLELSKIALRNERPLIQVIDEPVFPLLKSKQGKILSFLIGGVLAGLLTIVTLIVKKILIDIGL